MAVSASRSIACGASYAAALVAMPMLADVKTSWPSRSKACGKVLLDALGHAQRVADMLDVIEQDGEFVSAQPRDRMVRPESRDHVARPQAALQPPRDRDQQPISNNVPEAVVDQLEAIQIEEQHRTQ